MARILNLEFPTVQPSGATSASGENIPSSPNMFGGLGAQTEETFGRGLERAGNEVIDFAQARQKELNKVDASDRLTKFTNAITDESEKYTSTDGHAAILALPEHKEKIKSLYDDALANASNPQVKAMLAESGARTLDRYYGYAAAHSAREENVYNKKVAADATLTRMDQAVYAYKNGDYAGFENQRHHALAETRNVYEFEGYEPAQIEAEVAKTNGKIVLDTTKLILDQPQGGVKKAEDFAKRYESEIDAKSNVAIDGMLRGARAVQLGNDTADQALGRTRGGATAAEGAPTQASFPTPGAAAQPAAVSSPATARGYDFRAAEAAVMDQLKDNPQAQNAAFARINRLRQVTEGQEADNERARRMAEHAAKVASDDAEMGALKDIYSNRPTLTAPQIIDSPVLSREAKDRLIAQLGKADTGEHAERTYGPGFFDAYQAVHAPPGDPGRITDPSQLYAMVGPHGSLTVAGVDKLITEINARKTPEGEAEAAMRKQFFDNARHEITYSNEVLKLKDPDGDANFLRFQAAAYTALDEGKKAGKTPIQLLDPESPDYVGKIIDRFKPREDQSIGDRLKDAVPQPGFFSRIGSALASGLREAAKPAPPLIDTRAINSLADLQVAYGDRRISAEEARKLAIERGWARAPQPTPRVPNTP
jgi:hypothetical protein